MRLYQPTVPRPNPGTPDHLAGCARRFLPGDRRKPNPEMNSQASQKSGVAGSHSPSAWFCRTVLRSFAGLWRFSQSACLPCAAGFFLLASCSDPEVATPPQLLLDEGWEMYRLGEFGPAIDLFQRAGQGLNDTESQLALQALYGEAACWQHRRDARDTSRAESLYTEIIRRAPEDSLAVWSRLAQARIRHFGTIEPKPDYRVLAEEYRSIYSDHPDHPAGQEAFVSQYAVLLFNPWGDPEATRGCIPEMEAFVAQNPKSPFASTISKLLANAYSSINQPDRSVAWMVNSLETMEIDPGNPNANYSDFYWNIARTAEFEAGDFDTARTYYSRLIREYPKDQRIHEARTSLRRMRETEQLVREGRLPRQSNPREES